MIMTSTIGGKTIVVLFKTIVIVFKTIAIVFKRMRSRPMLAQFKSTMAHSNRLNEPDLLIISVFGCWDLLSAVKIVLQAFQMAISSFRYGKRGVSRSTHDRFCGPPGVVF